MTTDINVVLADKVGIKLRIEKILPKSGVEPRALALGI